MESFEYAHFNNFYAYLIILDCFEARYGSTVTRAHDIKGLADLKWKDQEELKRIFGNSDSSSDSENDSDYDDEDDEYEEDKGIHYKIFIFTF